MDKSKATLKPKFTKHNKANRLYNVEIPIIGLTGGIASGKSTVSKLLAEKQLNIIDADLLVKNIYKEQESIDFIKSINSSLVTGNNIDFKQLRVLFYSNIEIKKKIEEYIYKKLPIFFTRELNKLSCNVVIYDVPLLFENELQSKFDLTCLVYCKQSLQIERLIKRDNNDYDLAKKIIDTQLNIEDKKILADSIIYNESTLEDLKYAVEQWYEYYLN